MMSKDVAQTQTIVRPRGNRSPDCFVNCVYAASLPACDMLC